MIGFEKSSSPTKMLNDVAVAEIYANLTSGSDIGTARPLVENKNLCFMGVTRIGEFDLSAQDARRLLSSPINPNGKPNSDVVKPWRNAIDLTRRDRGLYIVDFGIDLSEQEAALYELPFEAVKAKVKPGRDNNRRDTYRSKWWMFGEPRANLRAALRGKGRYIATPLVSKHRVFAWFEPNVVPENLINAIARDDDYFFGVLHSRIHETWGLHQGTQLEDRPRYTPDSTFDTFPFPWPPGTEPSEDADPRVKAIADAARELVRLRDAWLHPPGTPEAELKDRTLTNLYNKRPAWLAHAHGVLDKAVFAAYGWTEEPAALPEQELLARLLALNHERAATQPAKAAKQAKAGRKRKDVEGESANSRSPAGMTGRKAKTNADPLRG